MTRADARPPGAARRRAVRALLATVVATLVAAFVPAFVPAVWAPAATAADADRLAVTIDSLSPSALTEGDTLTISGRISNPSSQSWSRLRVHLVMPSSPLANLDAVDDALAHPSAAVTGTRLTDAGTVVAAGDLPPGETTSFHLEVPFDLLRVSGSGAYPVGVHVLATGPDGVRSDDAVGRAHTVVPYVGEERTRSVPVSVVWPFVSPVQRDQDNRYVDTTGLVESVSPGGRLRRMLDLATSDPSSPSTVLLDPALLDALRDISDDSFGPNRANGPGGDAAFAADDLPEDASDEARRVRSFLVDLLDYAKGHNVWALPYGRPDVFAITRKSAGEPGATVVDAARRATQATLAQFGLSARLVYWPPNGITNNNRIRGAREVGSTLALVSPDVLAGWTPSNGTALRTTIDQAPIDLAVLDPGLDGSSTSTSPALAVRQRVATQAALAALGRGSGQVLAIAPSAFDPGTEWSRAQFHELFDAPWVRPTVADAQLGDRAGSWPTRVSLPRRANQRAIDRSQVAAAADIVSSGDVVSQLLGDDARRDVYYAQSASLAASQDWRAARTRGIRHATEQAESVEALLSRVSVSATSFVTLSGSSGRFPVTITNDLPYPVTVGVRFTSDDASARINDIAPQQITAGQSVTITVTADVGQATTTTITAGLVTSQDAPVGEPTQFTVRSSVVGRVIWVFLGLALLLVFIAVGRRVVKGRPVETLHDEEDDAASDDAASDDADDAAKDGAGGEPDAGEDEPATAGRDSTGREPDR